MTIRTLRHYDALGLLRPSGRSGAAYRLYSPADLTRLLHIQSLKGVGLSLPEIARALDDPAYDAQEVLRQHIGILEERIAQEQNLVGRLRALQGVAEIGWTDVAETIALTRRVEGQVGRFMQAAQEIAGTLRLTLQQLQHLQELRQGVGEDDWESLLTDVLMALEHGVSPTSPEAQALATRWGHLVHCTTAGQPDVAQALGRAYEQHLPTELHRAWTFIAEAMSRRQDGATMTHQTRQQVTDLSHPDKNVRIRAALDLGTARQHAALPSLIGRLSWEPDFFVRENLTWAVVRMGPDAVPPLLELLESPDPQGRLQAVHTLSKIADPASASALSPLLNDPDDEVARKAVFALGQMGNPDALTALLAGVGHPDAERRTTLGNALAQFGSLAVPLLLERLGHPHAPARTHAADILGLLGDPAAAPVLTGVLLNEAEAWEVRFAALSALGQLPGEDADRGVAQATHLDDPKLRAVAQRLTADRARPVDSLQQRLRQRRSGG